VLSHALEGAPSAPRRRHRIWGTWPPNLSARFPAAPLVALAPLALLGACSPPGLNGQQARLRPTLELRQADGGEVAYQSGRPVPTFSPQDRDGIDLGGDWRFQEAPLDRDLTFADRPGAVRALTAEAGDRLKDAYDDSSWPVLSVPGTFSPPPSSRGTGGWYRRTFPVPDGWDTFATLKFQSAGYVADVWLNGRYLGYHEGASTPFALDASDALRPGTVNTLVVRVDDPAWGTRLDIVPWGLADWWNYGGITGPVFLEATPALSVVRADVVPHLDGADVSVVLQNRGPDASGLTLVTEVLPASVGADNVSDPDPADLVPRGAAPVVTQTTDLDPMPGGDVRRVGTTFVIRRGDLWSPIRPALYVLRLTLADASGVVDHLSETFGLRQIRVDSTGPRLLLNGSPFVFHGVAVDDERQSPAGGLRPAGGPTTSVADVMAKLVQAQAVNADLIRAGHTPANPLLLMLADRLGFAVWEEIPLYHYTPETFQLAMARGIPQQMVQEMALRDMDHPSVLFHGFANESTGGAERSSALDALRDVDRHLDGTRLVGQAAYGSDPVDDTSAGMDVAGYTFYPGVFYGGPLDAAAIGRALDAFHARYPRKPVLILEFGRWADTPDQEPEQTRVFELTYGQMARRFDTLPGGFVGAAVWWSLEDYWTQRPGIEVEHFGLFRPDGSARPVGTLAAQAYAAESGAAQRPPETRVVSGGVGAPAGRPGASRLLVGLLLYAVAVPTVILGAVVVLLLTTPSHRQPPVRSKGGQA